MRSAKISVIEIASAYPSCQDKIANVLAQPGLRLRWQLNFDFSASAAALADELSNDNMNQPFWGRCIYLIEPSTGPISG